MLFVVFDVLLCEENMLGSRAKRMVSNSSNGSAACTAIFCRKDMAMEHDRSDTNPMSKLMNPSDKENDLSCVGHGISNVKVNAVKICIQP